jgi:hypothetical protein
MHDTLIGMVVPFGLQQFQILPTLLLILAEISDGLRSYSNDNVFIIRSEHLLELRLNYSSDGFPAHLPLCLLLKRRSCVRALVCLYSNKGKSAEKVYESVNITASRVDVLRLTIKSGVRYSVVFR